MPQPARQTSPSLEKQDFAAGLEYLRRALAIREKAFGPAHPAVAISLNNLGNGLAQMGDTEAAIAIYKRAIDVKTAAFGETSLTVATTRGSSVSTSTQQGKFREALDVMERALAIRQRLLPPDHVELARTYGSIAEPLLGLHRWDSDRQREEAD